MALVSTALTIWLGSMFLYSAGLKFANYDNAGNFLKPYRIVPLRVGSVIGFLLPWVELCAGLLLLLGLIFPLGPLLGVILGTSFAYASFRVLRRGADVPCGCTGGTKERVNRITLLRAILIIMSSLFLMAGQTTPFHLSLLVVIPLILVSLLPAVRVLYHRNRATRWRQVSQRNLQEEIVRARHILTTPPATSMLNN